MSLVVFLGPSLSLQRARDILPDATYLPPAQCGDVLRALERKPSGIALIDGIFEQAAAVWHKEILLALHQPLPVFGASSMGALRAAELAYFGMQGVGKIYRAYHSRELEDDDEVALLHTPAEAGFQKLTEPMVNVRETLLAACRAGEISSGQCAELIAYSKNIFYKERTWKKILDYLEERTIARLRPWIHTHYVDQKALDAELLLRQLASTALEVKASQFQLSRTIFLERLNDQLRQPEENISRIIERLPPRLGKIYRQVKKTMEYLALEKSLVLIDRSHREAMCQAFCTLLKLSFQTVSEELRSVIVDLVQDLIVLEQYLTEEGLVPRQSHAQALQAKIRQRLALAADADPVQVFLMAQIYFLCQEFCAESSELFLKSAHTGRGAINVSTMCYPMV